MIFGRSCRYQFLIAFRKYPTAGLLSIELLSGPDPDLDRDLEISPRIRGIRADSGRFWLDAK
jgi:hypothetical protein